MEKKTGTGKMLDILHIIAWIIFIGLCVEAGSFIFSAFYTVFINTNNSYLSLTPLYQHDHGDYYVQLLIMTIVGVLRALMFYLIIKILQGKKLNLAQPFNNEVGRFIFNLAYLALGIGLFSYAGLNYREWLVEKGVAMPGIETLRLAGGDVWIFMGITLYVIAQVFKRGIEIQSENDLTI